MFETIGPLLKKLTTSTPLRYLQRRTIIYIPTHDNFVLFTVLHAVYMHFRTRHVICNFVMNLADFRGDELWVLVLSTRR